MSLCTVPLGSDGALDLGGARIDASAVKANGRDRLVVGLRPESVELASDGVPAQVQVVEELGADAYVFCTSEVAGSETRLVARADPHHPPAIGDRVNLQLRGEDAHFFDAESGARL
jgi:multiple sugar transport system ATP-binding protein